MREISWGQNISIDLTYNLIQYKYTKKKIVYDNGRLELSVSVAQDTI